MKSFGMMMILAGLALAALGALFLLADKIPFLGRLPGDVHIEGKNASFHFPVVTCLIVSAILTVVLNVIVRLLKR